jgi:SAM-dependent methyltransferase
MDLEQHTRREFFSKFISKDFTGLEIGPSYRPTFPKSEGWNIKVLDHCKKAELISKYASLKVPKSFLNAIEEVDYVWKSEKYSELISKNEQDLKYVVACHVIEHVNDFLDFLNQMSQILEKDGYLLLAIPDKKSTFDFYRPNSTLGDVVIGNLSPSLYDIMAQIDEDYLRCELDGAIAWNQEVSSEAIATGNFPAPSIGFEPISDLIRSKLRKNHESEDEYRDGHRWIFTTSSFIDLVNALRTIGLIDFSVEEYQETNYYEFLVALRKNLNQQDVVLRKRELLFDMAPPLSMSSNLNSSTHGFFNDLKKLIPASIMVRAKSVRSRISQLQNWN